MTRPSHIPGGWRDVACRLREQDPAAWARCDDYVRRTWSIAPVDRISFDDLPWAGHPLLWERLQRAAATQPGGDGGEIAIAFLEECRDLPVSMARVTFANRRLAVVIPYTLWWQPNPDAPQYEIFGLGPEGKRGDAARMQCLLDRIAAHPYPVPPGPGPA
ncbi:hypothetical protein [Roseicella sp. DB1501]|uniref:hypothetical protein n=1 Tax=Roseicella sp. DB1501 TaxID=2730925 RepID=UPI00149249C0|nr:hypothetical protein [Roseicella sp. DB1501]NOG70025.1 hypothetical protein [Roseicella sp. DB1501]